MFSRHPNQPDTDRSGLPGNTVFFKADYKFAEQYVNSTLQKQARISRNTGFSVQELSEDRAKLSAITL